jgi:hypothetical protein
VSITTLILLGCPLTLSVIVAPGAVSVRYGIEALVSHGSNGRVVIADTINRDALGRIGRTLLPRMAIGCRVTAGHVSCR